MPKPIPVFKVRITLDRAKFFACPRNNHDYARAVYEKIRGVWVRICLPGQPEWRCGARWSWQLYPPDAARIGSNAGDDVQICEHMIDVPEQLIPSPHKQPKPIGKTLPN